MSQRSLENWGDADGGTEDTSRGSKEGTALPQTCLSFEIRGPWAHFRRVEGNIVKQTYRIPPRTTVAGIVAAILGIGRDQYYEAFGPAVSAMAIEPLAELRTMNVPQNTLSTAKEHLKTVPSRGHARVSLPDPTELRQQHNYELLVEPAYRVDLRLGDDGLYERLRDRLAAGTSYYPPSLGLSEHLAEVDYLGEFDVTSVESADVRVDSVIINAVDDVVMEPETQVRVERSPGYMAADSGGRTTTEFLTVAYSPAGESLSVTDVEAVEVDGRRVIFE
ncbi:type I-B CRISPR-associated protein Cas5b [Halobellus sp. GM3]|uniref:type I-B CRISPR-associated protein Cas5b n=1 Tax=Halobellus sp. GM3 TaxID=3458410 RepID=UPI00403E05C2